MKKNLQTFVFYMIFISTAACSGSSDGSPNPSRASVREVPENTETLKTMAFVYEGQDIHGQPCTLSLSREKQNYGEGDHEKESAILARMDYILHGVKPMDVAVEPYRYDMDQNKFFGSESSRENTFFVFLSILLMDEEEVVEVNKLSEYEQEGKLAQSMRIDFKEGENEGSDHGQRDIQRVVIKFEHQGHYDGSACLNFKLTGVKEVEFDVDPSSSHSGDYGEEDGSHEEEDHHHGKNDSHEEEDHHHGKNDSHEEEDHHHGKNDSHEEEDHHHGEDQHQ